jgi:putative hemolysin
MHVLLIFLLILLIFLSGFFSGSETALFSLPATKRQLYAQSVDPTEQKIAALLSHPEELLVTVFMLNTFVNIFLQSVASTLFGKTSSWLFKVGVPLILTLILGEILPKTISLIKNEQVAKKTAPLLDFFHRHLKSVRQFVAKLTYPISRMMFFFLKPQKEISLQELQHTLNTSEKEGVLSKYESHLISGYLSLKESQVQEIMRPKNEIIAFDLEEPLSTLIHLFVKEKCSKIPIYKKNLDHILGIVTVNQFFAFQKIIKSEKELLKIAEKPFYTPETTHAITLLRQMDALGKEIAITVNEYGSTTGLITREDLIETVVGEIEDMRDQDSHYRSIGKYELIADSTMELNELNALFDTELESHANMITIGGWIQEKTGEILSVGEHYEDEDYHFQVLEKAPQKILKLYVRRKIK